MIETVNQLCVLPSPIKVCIGKRTLGLVDRVVARISKIYRFKWYLSIVALVVVVCICVCIYETRLRLGKVFSTLCVCVLVSLRRV